MFKYLSTKLIWLYYNITMQRVYWDDDIGSVNMYWRYTGEINVYVNRVHDDLSRNVASAVSVFHKTPFTAAYL